MIILIAILLGLYVTYPVKKFVKLLFRKLEMPPKSLAIVTFITSSLLFTFAVILIYGFTIQCVYMLTGCIIALAHWLFLDFECLIENSQIIEILNKKSFRYSFGTFLAFSIFIGTMTWFLSFDPFYITPLIITILYMVFVYRKPRINKNDKIITLRQ